MTHYKLNRIWNKLKAQVEIISNFVYKSEVVSRLQEKGCNVKSVHALNVILEGMGLQERSGRDWVTTDAGVPFTIYRGRVFNADAWHPSIVDAVYDYLRTK